MTFLLAPSLAIWNRARLASALTALLFLANGVLGANARANPESPLSLGTLNIEPFSPQVSMQPPPAAGDSMATYLSGPLRDRWRRYEALGDRWQSLQMERQQLDVELPEGPKKQSVIDSLRARQSDAIRKMVALEDRMLQEFEQQPATAGNALAHGQLWSLKADSAASNAQRNTCLRESLRAYTVAIEFARPTKDAQIVRLAQYRRGRVLLELGRPDEAISSFEAIVAGDDALADHAALHLASQHFRASRWTQAAEASRRVAHKADGTHRNLAWYILFWSNLLANDAPGATYAAGKILACECRLRDDFIKKDFHALVSALLRAGSQFEHAIAHLPESTRQQMWRLRDEGKLPTTDHSSRNHVQKMLRTQLYLLSSDCLTRADPRGFALEGTVSLAATHGAPTVHLNLRSPKLGQLQQLELCITNNVQLYFKSPFPPLKARLVGRAL